ncbi:hypothetical protein Pelo_14633 [Pelomyxa schiedti]|nr:hypothetical protein Pelo_14633 [Pelomyxa schiedti]
MGRLTGTAAPPPKSSTTSATTSASAAAPAATATSTAAATSTGASTGGLLLPAEPERVPWGTFLQDGSSATFDVTPDGHVSYGGKAYARHMVSPTVFAADDNWLYIWTGSEYHCIKQGSCIIHAKETGTNTYTQTNNGTVLEFDGKHITYNNRSYPTTAVSPTVCYNEDGDFWYYVQTAEGLYIVNYISNSGWCTAKPKSPGNF